MRTINGVDELASLVGQELGVSGWMLMDQDRINRFADATGDHQWIHLDQERCVRESPFGTTIAHGFLTLSMLPVLASEIFTVTGVRASLNYGCNRVRFTGAVKSGSNIRLRLSLREVTPRDDGQVQVISDAVMEMEGSDRPVCVAESVALYLP